jgi:AcrR family transcriptional regulator
MTRTQSRGSGTRRRRRRARNGKPARAREDWIAKARAALIRGGIEAVKVVPLAKALKVTRGGFYWHFRNLQDLLDALLADWERTNTKPFEAVVESRSGANGMAEFRAVVDMWVAEESYSPAWDTAVRNWARQSKKVANVVKRVDEHRIDLLRQIFLDLGYRNPEALVRARVTYFHQVGYYSLGLEESHERRLELLPVYIDVLTGKSAR